MFIRYESELGNRVKEGERGRTGEREEERQRERGREGEGGEKERRENVHTYVVVHVLL